MTGIRFSDMQSRPHRVLRIERAWGQRSYLYHPSQTAMFRKMFCSF
jgi:hypothetical protein